MSDIHTCSYHCHMPKCIKAQRDELREALANAVPEGWKLVPVEPTDEMLDAAYSAVGTAGPVGIFKAMLAASPEVRDE